MLEFVNFIKDCADILASTGIALVINDSLYDLELIYNQAFQELHTLSAVQVIVGIFSESISINSSSFICRGKRKRKKKENKLTTNRCN